ncbi:MAG: hypothetical protein IPH62_19650 [Ignavibacteriae bacterium]|nr:hypothetical protein [Ignavibacteriota bacterium]
MKLFIVEGNLLETKKNISEFSFIITELNKYLITEFSQILTEEEATEVSKNVISTFLNYLKFSGSLFLKNLKDVFFNAALSKKISLTTAGISLSNLIFGLVTKDYKISNLVMSPLGFAPTKYVQLNPGVLNSPMIVQDPLTLGIFSISLFLVLLIACTIYKMINKQAIVTVKSYSDYVSTMIGEVSRFNPELKNLNPISNKIYKKILEEQCSTIKEKKQLMVCGTKHYLDLNSKVIIPELFKGQLRNLINKKVDVSFIKSAADLFYFSGTDRASIFGHKLYDKYFSIFDNIIPEDREFKVTCLKNLNNKCIGILKKETKNVR